MSKYINADKLCEDLMSRWEIADKEKEKEIQSIMADIVTPIVVGQPSADVVEVKHGKWIRLPDGWDGVDEYERYKCSVCNQPNSWGDTPFCRWCGADMRERRESE